jgi:hypothetical protein
MSQKITEQTETITVFRNESGSPVGIIIAQDEFAKPLYGAFIYCSMNGWKWLSESIDKEKVYHEAREHFFRHNHFCNACGYDIECELSYKCTDPTREKEEICEDCRDRWQKRTHTNLEIAENFSIWQTYIEAVRHTSEKQFFSMTLQARVEKIESIFADCQGEAQPPAAPSDAHVESQLEERAEIYG